MADSGFLARGIMSAGHDGPLTDQNLYPRPVHAVAVVLGENIFITAALLCTGLGRSVTRPPSKESHCLHDGLMLRARRNHRYLPYLSILIATALWNEADERLPGSRPGGSRAKITIPYASSRSNIATRHRIQGKEKGERTNIERGVGKCGEKPVSVGVLRA
ncbi:uncharacterized protein BDW47DRAFT_28149 [Aspergillus candidus]|uniref:Uncharacterized protein n=1 Tax=Aspergillus candidus TaxID=41067 RepID=A0A2I2FCH8_ASPCN|nr:hypothetical protein BDW47DRAFT_28149 [Aspergillus candidus]PLB38333.1 hypothetical protein BDW47DRAFT_28149 [Aspergillus candidus]